MKTALQQLIEYLDPIHSGIKQKAEELLKVEKDQIIDAYGFGYQNGCDDTKVNIKIDDSEQYYDETYN